MLMVETYGGKSVGFVEGLAFSLMRRKEWGFQFKQEKRGAKNE